MGSRSGRHDRCIAVLPSLRLDRAVDDHSGRGKERVIDGTVVGLPDLRGGPAGAPAHLVLPGLPDWRLWPTGVLRSAGFAVDTVAKLAQPECAAAADRVNALDGEFAARADAAMAAVRALHDARRADGHVTTTKVLQKTLRALRAGRPPAPTTLDDAAADRALGEVHAAAERRDRAGRDYQVAYADAARDTSRVLHRYAGDPRFCEAVIWQNRHAYDTAVRLLREEPADGGRNSVRRQRERLVAIATQRYAVKNDTIGFFGPVCWAGLTDDPEPLWVRHGRQELRQRFVHFEQWAVDAVADVLGSQAGLEPWLCPRRLPFARLDGAVVHALDAPPLLLSAAAASVLAACTGNRQAREIAADLVAAGVDGLSSAADVYAALADLRARHLITWALEVPFVSDADRVLSAALARVGDARLRQTSERAVRVLGAARDAVARAAGRPDELNRSIGRLEAVFERLTGVPATRHHGRTYGGRTVVYEDCVRDLEVRVGAPVLAELAGPLGLVLRAARWVANEAVRRYARLLRDAYHDAGGGLVPGYTLWRRATEVFPVLSDDYRRPNPVIAELEADLHQRWRDVFGPIDPSRRQLRFSVAELESRVAARFPAGPPLSRLARYHSPDIMIAARDAEAIRRGEYQLVLGEVHISANTLDSALFFDAHPDPDTLLRLADEDTADGCVIPLPSRGWQSVTSRTRNALLPPQAVYLLMSHEFLPEGGVPIVPGARRLALAEIVAEQLGDRIVARTRDGRFSCDLIDMFAEVVAMTVGSVSRLFMTGAHVPRITMDRLVVQRESWAFPAGAVSFPTVESEPERYRQARRWAADHDLPTRSFYSVPVEEKPVFLDLDSPILVDVFAKLVRRTQREVPDGTVRLSEMLPDVGDAWLTDAAGRHYTSELRVVAVDRQRRQNGSDHG